MDSRVDVSKGDCGAQSSVSTSNSILSQSQLTTCFVAQNPKRLTFFPTISTTYTQKSHTLSLLLVQLVSTQLSSLNSPASYLSIQWRLREFQPQPTPQAPPPLPRAFSPKPLLSYLRMVRTELASVSPGGQRRRRPRGPSLVALSTTLRFRLRRKVSLKPQTTESSSSTILEKRFNFHSR